MRPAACFCSEPLYAPQVDFAVGGLRPRLRMGQQATCPLSRVSPARGSSARAPPLHLQKGGSAQKPRSSRRCPCAGGSRAQPPDQQPGLGWRCPCAGGARSGPRAPSRARRPTTPLKASMSEHSLRACQALRAGHEPPRVGPPPGRALKAAGPCGPVQRPPSPAPWGPGATEGAGTPGPDAFAGPPPGGAGAGPRHHYKLKQGATPTFVPELTLPEDPTPFFCTMLTPS